MKNLYPLLICVCILSVSHFNAFAQDVVYFQDETLDTEVRSQLEKEGHLQAGDDITREALLELTFLYVFGAITSLEGLQYATNLENLTLSNSEISDIELLRPLINLERLSLSRNQISDITPLSNLIGLTNLILDRNQISDITPLSNLTNLTGLGLRDNPIGDFSPISDLTGLKTLGLIDTGFSDSDIDILKPLTNLRTLFLSRNEISNLTSLATALSGMDALSGLHLDSNQISDLSPLETLTNLTELLRSLYLNDNQIDDISPLKNLKSLTELRFHCNQVSDLSPLAELTALTTLAICPNPYTDINSLAPLTNLTRLYIDEEFMEAAMAMFPNARLYSCFSCPPRPEPPSEAETETETEAEPEPAVKQRSSIARCGLGWSPHSQYQHHGELPKVMIYALEFEYDPEGHGRYICKTIEIRTGDDSIKNLAGWNLYLGTLYNPSRIPLKIPEESSQITDGILRITPEMLGLETFPCNTVNGISHPLPGVQYVLKTDENILVDTAYSCFVWGQNAYTTVNDKNVESPRRISSQVLREMDTPRIERYITNPTGIFITDIPFEDFAWDRAVLSDWLLGLSEETVAAGPNAPFLPDKKLTTTWGAIKKPPALRQSNFKHKPVR